MVQQHNYSLHSIAQRALALRQQWLRWHALQLSSQQQHQQQQCSIAEGVSPFSADVHATYAEGGTRYTAFADGRVSGASQLTLFLHTLLVVSYTCGVAYRAQLSEVLHHAVLAICALAKNECVNCTDSIRMNTLF
jgi:hypothetical protein